MIQSSAHAGVMAVVKDSSVAMVAIRPFNLVWKSDINMGHIIAGMQRVPKD
jgi:hypothetical protein